MNSRPMKFPMKNAATWRRDGLLFQLHEYEQKGGVSIAGMIIVRRGEKLAHARSGARRVDRCLRFLSRCVKAKQRTHNAAHRELYDGECNDVVAIPHRQFPARVPKEVHCR